MDEQLKYMQEQYNMQSRLQSEASEEQARLYAPQMREQLLEHQAAVIAQTNPAKALKVIIEGFRGNMIDENGEVQNVGFPLMNQKGIARISSMLIPFVNDPVRFGNISDKEVRSLTLKITNDITKDIGLNWREYGITHSTTKDIIIDSCMTLIFITLTRSQEGGEKNFLAKVILESVAGGPKQAKKKESFYDKFLKL